MLLKVAVIIILGVIDLSLFFKMLWGPTGLMEVQSLKNQYKTIQQKAVDLERENLDLSREIRLMQTDNSYAEKMVRQKLHYLRDNEIVYLFSNDHNKGVRANDGKN